MKRQILTTALLALICTGAYAQRDKVKIQDTQARLLDVTSNAYVKPLTVELKVDKTKGRIRDEWTLTKEQAEGEMEGDIVSSQQHDADVIVAATFNFRTNDEGTGYLITVVGYPATFENWKTADSSDLEWIRMEKTLTTNDREKISAVVK